MGLNELTIVEALTGLRAKKFNAAELVSDCLQAISRKDNRLHAYLQVFDEALEEARGADKILTAGRKLPPLLGIPLAIKDNILIRGKHCTAGSKILQSYIAPYDATAIRKLKSAGAIFLGKTNLDEFAMGASTENSSFGPTKNPRDETRVPGGSSGGSAAAVASDMCAAAIGSDTGGSIRQPAAFCGVVGLKPTYGRVSRHGLIAMASSLDVIGPITKTVEDAKVLFKVIAGEDPFDATTVKTTHNPQLTTYNLKDIRIGVPKEYFGKGLDQEVKKIVESSTKKLAEAGAQIKEITLPHSEYALATYYIIVPSEVSANLARYDGIRYGASATCSLQPATCSLSDVYAKTRSAGLGQEVKRRIMLGTYALSAGYYDAYYIKAQKVRSLIRQDFERAFEDVDIIIGPTAPTPAFKLGEKTEDPLQMYLADIYTAPISLAGLPAISLPAGWADAGGTKLPVGLQLVGKWFDEEKLLSVAGIAEKILK